VPVRLIRGSEPIPPPEESDARGLVAVGGDLAPARLLDAYRRGIFPWYEEGLPILWHSPDPRMVLLASRLKISRTLRKQIRRAPFQITMDRAFRSVVERCAKVSRAGQDGTWITQDMVNAYDALHGLGHAHSVEAWADGTLVGGLYGVAVGGIFCGESMFADASDASKIAFVWIIRLLQRWGIDSVDCLVHTDHL
jgi:leucyl/phenylalanyl-tRNA--protein transferase